MKGIILILLSLLFIKELNGQGLTFKPGVYLNLEQLQAGTPAFNADFKIKKRSSEDITLNGGNDYKLISENDSHRKKFIKREVFAYIKNDTILLNGFPNNIQIWYSMCLIKGNFMLFKGAMNNSDATVLSITGGAIGGAIASNKRHLYVLSLRTGNFRECTEEYLKERIKENIPTLLDQYQNDVMANKKDFESVAYKYINLLNEYLVSKAQN